MSVRAVPSGATPTWPAGLARDDGDRVQRAFDDDRGGSGGEPVGVLGEPVQLVALGEQDGLAGVQVLRAGLGGRFGARLERVVVGVAAADEPDHLQRRAASARRCTVRRDGAWMGRMSRSRKVSMSRPVEACLARPAARSSSSVAPWRRRWSVRAVQLCGGVAGADAEVAGQVGAAEPFGEVGLGPGAAVRGLVEDGGLLVELGDPLGADRGELGVGDPGQQHVPAAARWVPTRTAARRLAARNSSSSSSASVEGDHARRGWSPRPAGAVGRCASRSGRSSPAAARRGCPGRRDPSGACGSWLCRVVAMCRSSGGAVSASYGSSGYVAGRRPGSRSRRSSEGRRGVGS